MSYLLALPLELRKELEYYRMNRCHLEFFKELFENHRIHWLIENITCYTSSIVDLADELNKYFEKYKLKSYFAVHNDPYKSYNHSANGIIYYFIEFCPVYHDVITYNEFYDLVNDFINPFKLQKNMYREDHQNIPSIYNGLLRKYGFCKRLVLYSDGWTDQIEFLNVS